MFQITPDNAPYMYFSQFGEDMMIIQYFQSKKNGFFVDVGAHHPFHFSNTFASYMRGWSGINIEPDIRNIALFKELRPRDTTLNIGIAKTRGKLPFYQFKAGEINTFDSEKAKILHEQAQFDTRIISSENVPTIPLREVLSKYAENKPIDYLSVDTEGFDLEVLESSDWNQFRPTLVLVEDLNFSVDQLECSEVYQFMVGKGYRLMGKTLATLIFEENEVYKSRNEALKRVWGR